MATLQLKETVKSNINAIPITPGQFIYCSDTFDEFYDTSEGVRIQITSLVCLDKESDIPLAPLPDKLYYVRETNALYKYDTSISKMVQINDSVQISDLIPTVSQLEAGSLVKDGKNIAPVTLSTVVYRGDGETVENALTNLENKTNTGSITYLNTEADRINLTAPAPGMYNVKENGMFYRYDTSWHSAGGSVGLLKATTTGTGDAYVLDVGEFMFDSKTTLIVQFHTDNTSSAPTLNINGTGAKVIKRNNDALLVGEIQSNKFGIISFGDNCYQLLSLDSNIFKRIKTQFGYATATTDKQKTFTIPVPYPSYLKDGYTFKVFLGSVLFDSSRYTVDATANTLTLNSDETGVDLNRILALEFIYDDIVVTNIKPGKITQEVFTATASQTEFDFTKGVYTMGQNAISWYVDGIKQSNSLIQELSPTSVKVSKAITAGQIVIFDIGQIISTVSDALSVNGVSVNDSASGADNTVNNAIWTANKINAIRPIILKNVNVPNNNWADERSTVGYYSYTITNSNILSGNMVTIQPNIETENLYDIAAFAKSVKVSNGSIKIYAKNVPTANLLINVLITR